MGPREDGDIADEVRRVGDRMRDDHHDQDLKLEKILAIGKALIGRFDALGTTGRFSNFGVYWKIGTVLAAAIAAFLGLRGV